MKRSIFKTVAKAYIYKHLPWEKEVFVSVMVRPKVCGENDITHEKLGSHYCVWNYQVKTALQLLHLRFFPHVLPALP